ncbi:hypothetical protein CSOJ01_12265, partial [Colletotrichum sojae]
MPPTQLEVPSKSESSAPCASAGPKTGPS